MKGLFRHKTSADITVAVLLAWVDRWQNCRIHHSVVGLRSFISQGAIIEDTLLMGADYYETEADRKFLAEKGSVPIGIRKNSYIKKAIIDNNARIGDDVKIINNDNVQEAAKETNGYFIQSGIVMIVKDALIPSAISDH
ncbi:glucose-1-phosphate adenylyltransferase small subunit-like [Hibiscus syriacus]|uniref:glucose-1-phosphate adenylyltransferase small subunit-like n=1 Tax=Hibiscus syriacus TaxID=106335 RepID=UPI00192482B6|nr:glucose-1-phosphate adenylyltransferase small subunit-like [Hibiscus syriacus]